MWRKRPNAMVISPPMNAASRFRVMVPRRRVRSLTGLAGKPRGSRAAPWGICGSEIPFQARRQGAFAGQFVVKSQRVQPVVLIGEIQQSHLRLHPPLPKAIAGHHVELPEIVSRNIRRVALVGLLRPDGAELAEETA